MQDIKSSTENPFSESIKENPLPMGNLSPEQRLDAIAEILAVAALRKRNQKSNKIDILRYVKHSE